MSVSLLNTTCVSSLLKFGSSTSHGFCPVDSHQNSLQCNTLSQQQYAGVTDHLAESEPHAIGIARNILGNLNQASAGMCTTWGQQLPHQAMSQQPAGSWEEPLYSAEEMRGAETTLQLSVKL